MTYDPKKWLIKGTPGLWVAWPPDTDDDPWTTVMVGRTWKQVTELARDYGKCV